MSTDLVLVDVEIEQGLCEVCGKWVDLVEHSLSHLMQKSDLALDVTVLKTLDFHRTTSRSAPCVGWFKRTRTITRKEFAQTFPRLRIVRYD